MPSWLIWGTVMFLLGAILYFPVPVLFAPIMPKRLRRRIAGRYYGMMADVMRMFLFVRRSVGSFTIEPAEYDDDIEGSLKFVLDGEKRNVHDPGDKMSLLFNRPCGLVYEGRDVILEPRDAEFGEFERDRVDRGDHKRKSDSGQRQYSGHLPIPDGRRLLDLADARYILPGSSKTSWASTAYQQAKKSQSGFDSRNAVEVMSLVMAFVVGVGAVWFLFSQGGGGGGGGVTDTISRGLHITTWGLSA